MSTTTIRQMLQEATEQHLDLTLVAGAEGLARVIEQPRVQKLGLAMSGYVDHIHDGRVQILGETETNYLAMLAEEERETVARTLCGRDVPCIIVTKGLAVPAEFKHWGDELRTPILVSPLPTTEFIARCTRYMEDRASPTTTVHGVFIDVSGVGVLITGASGMGKSELALDLVTRGHRLVADDVVQVQWRGHELMGEAVDALGHHMELRGLGIINIPDLFGIGAVREHKRVDMVIELQAWDSTRHYDRLGLEQESVAVLEVSVPSLRIPVSPGRNLTTLVEVAARNFLLKSRGHHSAKEFLDRVDRALGPEEDDRDGGAA